MMSVDLTPNDDDANAAGADDDAGADANADGAEDLGDDANGGSDGDDDDDDDQGSDDAGDGKGDDDDSAGADDAGSDQVAFGDEKFDVSPELKTHIEALQEKAADREAPEAYELTVPDDLEIDADPDDPRWTALQELGKERGWSQDDINALTKLHYQAEIEGDQDYTANQKAELIKAFNDGGKLSDEKAQAAAQKEADWSMALLASEIKKNPAIKGALETLGSFAGGAQLIRAYRTQIGETKPPKSADLRDKSPELSTEAYFKEEVFGN